MEEKLYCAYLLYTRNLKSIKTEFYSEDIYYSLEMEVRDTDYQKSKFCRDLYFFVLSEPVWQRLAGRVK